MNPKAASELLEISSRIEDTVSIVQNVVHQWEHDEIN
jgi:hypothetical protein